MIFYTHCGSRSHICAYQKLFLVTTFLLMCSAPSFASEQFGLSLSEASHWALQNNPSLQTFQWRLKAIDGIRQSAALRPGYEVGIEAENMLGNGSLSGTDGLELTLSLSSVIELGGKRHSRVAVATSRYAMAEAERQASVLDLLGLITQRFIASLTLQEKLTVARDATKLAETTYNLVRQRVELGAAPEAERLRAKSALMQARLREKALAAELESRKLALATLWGAKTIEFGQLEGELFQFQNPIDFETLYDRVTLSPTIAIFASEARIRDAEVELAKSQTSNNLRWSVGVRRFEETGDSGFTAGVSMPLFSGRRNRGEIQAAVAQRGLVDSQKESTLLALRARLFEAWQTQKQSAAAAQALRRDVLPALEAALKETRIAYERGRYSYIDWVAAQRELLDARVMEIDAASTALLNQALIEQLTAEPLSMARDSQLKIVASQH